MSQDGSKSIASRKPSAQARVGGSTYSVNTTLRKTRAGLKEEMIAKKITEIFKEKEQRMIRTIEVTIVEDRLKIYKLKRQEYEEELNELEAERKKIMKRKKNKKERMKLCKQNTKQQFYLIAKALNATVLYYKQLYYENDYYRFKKLLDVQQAPEGEPPMDEKAKQKAQLDQLNNFFNSPFKDDRRFTIYHLAQITRDRLESSTTLVKNLFFNKIFPMLLTTTDEKNKIKAFEILCNLIQSTSHRKKLASMGYFKQVYDTMQVGKVDDKTLEKLSWMTTLICFHPDMIEQIVSLRLLNFIIKLVDNKFPPAVRSNAVLAISLLTYHEQLFNELISNGVIDIVMNLCMDQQGDLQVKQFSTLALVHFALSKQSINILIEKGIMDLFNSLGVIGDAQIQTNVSWIFLALCNNGITGKQMLTNGITRDMFLVSCNPQFSQIRHLVIAGFAELGRCTDVREQQERQANGSLQRIKEKAIVGMHDAFRLHASETINILLRFCISDEQKFMVTAYWALKDYILLNHDRLISDLSGVICAFVNGAAESSDQVKTECANAISFLITHQLVFNKSDAERKKETRSADAPVWEFNPNQNYVLDALMMLSGSESLQVRTRAFSTLSTLSTYASQSEDLMPQIQADIKMPDGVISRQYYEFIEKRIGQSREAFVQRYKESAIETKYAGLYCLLRLAQCPDEKIALETAIYLHQFYYPEHYASVTLDEQLQNMTATLQDELTKGQKERLSINLVRDDCDERDIALDSLNEKFFMFVFQALLYSKNTRILYLLLDVINFYIKHATEYQDKVINAATILWMLQILDHSRKDRDLCLLVAKTVLKIVDNHQIIFDYQEMAIIKKFNKALENLNKDPNMPADPSSDDEPEHDQLEQSSSHHRQQAIEADGRSQYDHMVDEAREQLEQSLTQGRLIEPTDFERLSERAKRSQPMEFQTEEKDKHLTENSSVLSEECKEPPGPSRDVHQTSVQQRESHQQSELVIHKGSVARTQSIRRSATDKHTATLDVPSKKEDDSCGQSSQQKDLPIDREDSCQQKQSDSDISLSEKHSYLQTKSVHSKAPSHHSSHPANRSEQPESHASNTQSQPRNNASITQHQIQLSQKQQQPDQSALVSAQSSQRHRASNQATSAHQTSQFSVSQKTKHNQSSKLKDQSQVKSGHSFVPTAEFAASNNELRDALIKSFMVIFTNEKSQHLLLNQDIIDIAFSCLQYCDSISVDAKRNLARLISIIFKFPQVQERILQDKIVHGIVHLLGQDLQQTSIISHALRSCTYISLSYNFVNSPLSLQVLQALTPLVDKLDCKKLASEAMSDKDNCLFAIANLLKGNTLNSKHFIQSDSPRKVMQELLSILDEMDSNDGQLADDRLEIVEICVSSIKQLANTKQTFREFLQFSTTNRQLITKCISRVFQLSDRWFKSEKELLRFQRILEQDNKENVQKVTKRPSIDLNSESLENFKAIEMLEDKEDRSIKMAPIVKVRNNLYFTIVGCFKSRFQVDFLLDECHLLKRLVDDLQRDKLNDYIFQHLIMCLQSLMKDHGALQKLFINHSAALLGLFTKIESLDKKIVYIKSIIQAVLRIPEHICDHNPEFFGQLFQMAINVDSSKHQEEIDDITENVLWLQTTLLELNLSESQTSKAVELCVKYKTAPILCKCLEQKNERIVLQALKGLSTMAEMSEFKRILLIDQGDKMFQSLADIINIHLSRFTQYRLEIETAIVSMLSSITTAQGGGDVLSVAARRRVVQQGFMDKYVEKCSAAEYRFSQEQDVDIDDELNSQSSGDELELDDKQLAVDCEFDDVDRVTDHNQMIEETMHLIANASELPENIPFLISQKSQVINFAVSVAQKLLTSAARTGQQFPVNMLEFSFGNLKLGKYLAQTFQNLLSRPQEGSKQSGQDVCVKNGFGQLAVQLVHTISDYDMHIQLYQGIADLILSPDMRVAQMAVEQGCYAELSKAAYDSEFHKVRRICTDALDKAPQQLADADAKQQKKRY